MQLIDRCLGLALLSSLSTAGSIKDLSGKCQQQEIHGRKEMSSATQSLKAIASKEVKERRICIRAQSGLTRQGGSRHLTPVLENLAVCSTPERPLVPSQGPPSVFTLPNFSRYGISPPSSPAQVPAPPRPLAATTSGTTGATYSSSYLPLHKAVSPPG